MTQYYFDCQATIKVYMTNYFFRVLHLRYKIMNYECLKVYILYANVLKTFNKQIK